MAVARLKYTKSCDPISTQQSFIQSYDFEIEFVAHIHPALYFFQNLYSHKKHRHRRNVTSHHFTSLLFTSFHFYVYSNFFGSYQLKGKYNTHTHIQQLINGSFSQKE